MNCTVLCIIMRITFYTPVILCPSSRVCFFYNALSLPMFGCVFVVAQYHVPYSGGVQGTTVKEMAPNGDYIQIPVPANAEAGSTITYKY